MADGKNGAVRKHRIRNNLFIKVYAAMFAVICLVVLVFGATFIRFYRQNYVESFGRELTSKAETVASVFSSAILKNEYNECWEYVEMLSSLESAEIWSISDSRAKNPLPQRLHTVSSSDLIDLQDEYYEVIAAAFDGMSDMRTFFSDVHDETRMIAGVPIRGIGGEVCGALLITTSLSSLDATLSRTYRMLGWSVLLALTVSFVATAFFVSSLTKPIRRMRTAALELSAGRYSTKTNVSRSDEIGDLARTLDFLSEKLVAAEEERRAMEQMRLDFFANVSHELRTPIAVVRAYTESLVDGVVTDPEQVEKYYGRMLAECKSMQRLVADLLLLSKMQNPDFNIEKEPVNLIDIFDEIVRGLKAISAERGIDIEFSAEEDIYMMLGDYDRLRQMFVVILDNAVKFSHDNSKVYITLSGKERIRASIRDEGVGISKEELPNIFDKFYKSKLRQNAKGTGLGLAIARQIALKHGGTIDVVSEKDVGTEFIFTFTGISLEEYEKLVQS